MHHCKFGHFHLCQCPAFKVKKKQIERQPPLIGLVLLFDHYRGNRKNLVAFSSTIVLILNINKTHNNFYSAFGK